MRYKALADKAGANLETDKIYEQTKTEITGRIQSISLS